MAFRQKLKNAFGVLHKMNIASLTRVFRRVITENKQRKRLVFFANDSNDISARTQETYAVDLNLARERRKTGKQAFHLIAVRANEYRSGMFGILKAGSNQKQSVFGHVLNHSS